MAGRTLRCWGSALSFSGAIGTVGSVIRLTWTGATLGESKIQLVSVAEIERGRVFVFVILCVFLLDVIFVSGFFFESNTHP